MYFKSMPNIVYPVGEDRVVIKDFFRHVASRNNLFKRSELEKYVVMDGDTPENLSYRYYGSTQYYWVILLCNDIVDPREDWPKTQADLLTFCQRKYGTTEVYEVHHYINEEGLHVDYDPAAVANGTQQEVTNLAYEADLNDAKKNLVLLRNNRLMQFIETYKRLINI